MRLIFLGILMWVGFTLRAQSFSTETIFTLHGASAIVTFNTPLLKSEKINFAQMGRFGIDYDGEHSMILLKSNISYDWTPSFATNAGLMFNDKNNIKPTLGLSGSSVNENHFFLFSPFITIQSKPQVWIISVVQFEKKLKNKKEGIFGLSVLQMFEKEGHRFTFGILHLGIEQNKFEYGFASYLKFFGKQFEFGYEPGIFLKYEFL